VTRTFLTAAAVVASGACAIAHQGAVAASAAPAISAQQPAPVPPSGGSQISRERLQRIYRIRQLESVLTNAVKTGATSLANELKLADPTSLFVSGNARARGFELDGYGVVFDVDVPTMMQSVLWSVQMLQRQQEMDRLRDAINDPRTTESIRQFARNELRRIERLTNPLTEPMPSPVRPVARGMVSATSTDAPAVSGLPDTSVPAPAVAPAPDPRSPDEMYTEVIKGALIQAMLDFGPTLRLGDDEWLTVAARAATPAVPNQLDDSSSLVIRVKGADLTAFLTGRISREEVLKKVEIKEG
jgi:hypothetical protein